MSSSSHSSEQGKDCLKDTYDRNSSNPDTPSTSGLVSGFNSTDVLNTISEKVSSVTNQNETLDQAINYVHENILGQKPQGVNLQGKDDNHTATTTEEKEKGDKEVVEMSDAQVEDFIREQYRSTKQ